MEENCVQEILRNNSDMIDADIALIFVKLLHGILTK